MYSASPTSVWTKLAGFVVTFPSELGETITNRRDVFFCPSNRWFMRSLCFCHDTSHPFRLENVLSGTSTLAAKQHCILVLFSYWVPSNLEELNYISAKDTGNERYVCHIKSEWRQCRYSYICKTLLVKANKICFYHIKEDISHLRVSVCRKSIMMIGSLGVLAQRDPVLHSIISIIIGLD